MTLPEIGPDLCLFLDVDGTLIDIAPRPEAVHVPPTLLAALEGVADGLGGAVALVSGRAIADIDRLFSPLKLRASGVHGAEMRFEPRGSTIEQNTDQLAPGFIDAVKAIAARFAGLLVENKRYSVAVHYREAPEAAAELQRALEELVSGSGDPDLRILPGHMVFDLKRATFDKGLAVARFMARPPFAGRTPVFLGDDVTDRPAFAAVLERGGQAFSVGPLLPGTTGTFSGPAAVRSWLAGYAAETGYA